MRGGRVQDRSEQVLRELDTESSPHTRNLSPDALSPHSPDPIPWSKFLREYLHGRDRFAPLECVVLCEGVCHRSQREAEVKAGSLGFNASL